MSRWGMTIDLNRCVGCQTCSIACKQANDTPKGVLWRRVIDVEYGSFPNVERLFVVTGCQHCENPPCVPVCPTGATQRRQDGLVTIDYDRCIGCASCVVACPYQARTISQKNEPYFGSQETLPEQRWPQEERIGVATKCTFCMDRIDNGLAKGLTPGIDMDATPACAATCIAQAIQFGDLDNPNSPVSKLIENNNNFQMHAELGTNPRVRYLYEIPDSMPGREVPSGDLNDEWLSDPGNPLVGKPQTFWDYRAAANFALGGLATGLTIIAWFAFVLGELDAITLGVVNMTAAAIMAVGLFFVFLKLGRKLRFLYVLLRPQSSWMTRETYCVALFYPAVAAGLIWQHPALYALSAAAAAGFLICQARILHASKGIPAWRAPLVPWMMIFSGLFEGLGLYSVFIFPVDSFTLFPGWIPIVAICLALINIGLWLAYQATGKTRGIQPLSLSRIGVLLPLVVGGGLLLPVGLFVLAPFVPVCGLLAGILAVAGGVVWKFALVTWICHQQGFALAKVPQRGSGSKAAPVRLESPVAG